jgi:hypothetical protein
MLQLALFTITLEKREYSDCTMLVEICRWWDGHIEILTRVLL